MSIFRNYEPELNSTDYSTAAITAVWRSLGLGDPAQSNKALNRATLFLIDSGSDSDYPSKKHPSLALVSTTCSIVLDGSIDACETGIGLRIIHTPMDAQGNPIELDAIETSYYLDRITATIGCVSVSYAWDHVRDIYRDATSAFDAIEGLLCHYASFVLDAPTARAPYNNISTN